MFIVCLYSAPNYEILIILVNNFIGIVNILYTTFMCVLITSLMMREVLNLYYIRVPPPLRSLFTMARTKLASGTTYRLQRIR